MFITKGPVMVPSVIDDALVVVLECTDLSPSDVIVSLSTLPMVVLPSFTTIEMFSVWLTVGES